MRTVRGLRGSPGLEWARLQLFGPDAAATPDQARVRKMFAEPARELVPAILECSARLSDVAARGGPFSSAVHAAGRSLLAHADDLESALHEVASSPVDRPFRVVLMGRTQAGKSTLFEYLSNGDGARVGDGRQRVTRESCLRSAAALGIDLVDTPGVGALDGADDYRAAFEQVALADLILWVASNDATQQQTGRALRQLGSLGKPIVVALNCRADLDNPIAWQDFLTEPDLIFGGDTLGNLGPIDRYLADVGAVRTNVVCLHADAALRARNARYDTETAARLHGNSRIDDLTELLRAERDRTAPQRRALSLCDQVRGDLLAAAHALSAAGLDLRQLATASRGAQAAFVRQARRRLADARDEMQAAVADIVGRRERWWEDFEVDGDVSKLWAKEATLMEAEIKKAVTEVHDRLTSDLTSISIDVADDWARLRPGTFTDLTGYGTSFGNRAIKVGGRLALALAGAEFGAQAGAAIGSLLPGPGTIAGGLVGGAVGGAVGGVIGLIPAVRQVVDKAADFLLRSTPEIHKRRRTQVHEQLRPMIEKIRQDLSERVVELADGWTTALDAHVAEQEAHIAGVDRAVGHIEDASVATRRAIEEVDTRTARTLLTAVGRSRAATQLIRATRWHGVGIIVELPEPAFTETLLYPPVDMAEQIVAVASSRWPSHIALQALVGLSSEDLVIDTIAQDQLSVSVTAPVPLGVRESWSALAFAHTGVRPLIAQGDIA